MDVSEAHVLTHGYCFDGLVSAALATHLVRERGGRDLSFTYRSCGYSPKARYLPESLFAGDVNVLLDFRYTESPRLTYYFDHHATSFASDAERSAALARAAAPQSGRWVHHDASYGSCAKLIADVARAQLDVDMSHLSSLVGWADKIDSASFDDPAEAFFARAPALAVADVVEHHGDAPFLARVVPRLLDEPLDSIAADPEIGSMAARLAESKEAFLAALRGRAVRLGDVVLVDLSGAQARPVGKFASYVAFPDCRYSVAVLRTQGQLKVGVGYNPWSGKPRMHDIAQLCKREGGGGHAVVGAVSFSHDDEARAREVAARIACELAG
jgi:hypothetical protein